MAKASVYVNSWNEVHNRATVLVHDDRPSARVTYRGDDGKKFRVNVIQRANPIGFRATLPGDKRSK